MYSDDYFMGLAIEEARLAFDKGEVPIGAVIVCNDEVVSKAHNLREISNRAIGHAEILAIDKANKKLNSWRLDSCTLYVTIEPCPMCAGAIIQSRIKKIVYGAKDLKAGVHQSVFNLFEYPFNHQVEVVSGVLETECREIIQTFFKSLRK